MRRLTYSLLILMVASLVGCGSSEDSANEEPAPTTVRERTVVERTIYQTVMEEPDEPEEPEEADAVIGERVFLGGVEFQIFDKREEETVYYFPSPESSPQSSDSSRGEYLAVDYNALNESGEDATISPEATLTDSDGNSYEVDTSIDRPTENAAGFTIGDEEFLSSTLFFDLPEDASPERLTLEYGDDKATVDLTERNADELEPKNYLAIYTLWFDQKAYDNIYDLYEPSSTQGISKGEWVSYFDSLWGEWYLSLDLLYFYSDLSSDTRSVVRMERTFYETSGAVTPNEVEQELVKVEDEWKFIMREDQVADITGTADYVPEETAPEYTEPTAPTEDLDCSDFPTQTDAQAELQADYSDPNNLDADGDGEACEDGFGPADDQYNSPNPDPDPDPNRPRKPRNTGQNNNGNQNNTPNYPTDGGPGPDKDCEDFSGPVIVSPGDPHDLDADDDGIGCDVN